MNDLQQQQVMGALGYPTLALPQTVQPVTNTKTTIQRTQYDPVKLQAVMTALNKPRALKTRGEVIAEALANVPEARSFTGGFGEEIINPWAMALSSFARGFGSAYKAKKEDERERANEAREDEIKALQLQLEATKQAIADETENTHMKFNLDPSVKTAQEQAATDRKIAQTAYVKLNPKLGDEFRENKESFAYAAREGDIGSRTPAGGTTGMAERIAAAVAKGYVGDDKIAKRGQLLQEATQYVTAITDLAKQGGATGQMMNSDKEGQRAMAMFAAPGYYTAEELGAAADTLVNLYNRMLAVRGMPSVEEGYNQVSKMVEAQKPQQTQPEVDIWAKYRTK